jgi:hypothetical protein
LGDPNRTTIIINARGTHNRYFGYPHGACNDMDAIGDLADLQWNLLG